MTDIDIDPQTVVDDFNAIHGSVTWVRYWTGTRDDAPKYNLTDGKAWLLGGHTPVVRVRGESSCIALTHVDVLPSQPDDIEDDSRDLPEPARAAERVREYVSAFGDGIYDVVDGHPLYGRDLEALGRAGAEVEQLRAELADVAAAIAPTVTVKPASAAARFLHSLYQDWVNTAHARLEQIDKLTAALTESRANAAKYANENGRLVAENARLRQDRDTQTDIAKNRADVITDLTEVIERVEQRANAHAAVVEAAKAWAEHYGNTSEAYHNAATSLAAAVDALPKAEVAR